MKRNPFLVLETPVDLNKRIIKTYLKSGHTVVDATCGNGHDSLFCAEIIKETGTLHCVDIQETALLKTKDLLSQKLISPPTITFHHADHATLKDLIHNPVDFFIYNLGYLPGSDKNITTSANATIASLESAFQMLKNNGLISLMVYRGHDHGEELRQIQDFLLSQDPLKFAVSKTEFLIRNNMPILFLIEKTSQNDCRKI